MQIIEDDPDRIIADRLYVGDTDMPTAGRFFVADYTTGSTWTKRCYVVPGRIGVGRIPEQKATKNGSTIDHKSYQI